MSAISEFLNQPVSAMLVLVGAALILNPLFNLRTYWRMSRRTCLTDGTVVSQKEFTSNPGFPGSGRIKTDHAVVKYQVDDQEYVCVSESGATWTQYPIGTLVKVCYDPAEPDNADIYKSHKASFWIMSGLVWAGPVVGVLLILVNIRVW